MNHIHRTLKTRGSAGGPDESGFTLIELLIVIVVLGILAAIVVFALGGVTNQGDVSACNSDSRTVDIGVQAAITENPTTYPTATGTWKTDLLSSSALVGGPFVQSWPVSGNGYSISVAGSGAAADTGDATTPANGDVVVTVSSSGNTFDYTANPTTACASV